jgi:hypothetical protein
VFLLSRVTRDPNNAGRAEMAIADITASQRAIAAGHAVGGHPSFWSPIGTILFDNGFFSRKNIGIPDPDRLIGTGT